jgi:hypothetical protein
MPQCSGKIHRDSVFTIWVTAGIKPVELFCFEPKREKRYQDVLEAWQETDCILFTGDNKRLFMAIRQSEIGLKFLSTVGACHQHAPNVLREAQFLSTFVALLYRVFMHSLRELNPNPLLSFVMQENFMNRIPDL